MGVTITTYSVETPFTGPTKSTFNLVGSVSFGVLGTVFINVSAEARSLNAQEFYRYPHVAALFRVIADELEKG